VRLLAAGVFFSAAVAAFAAALVAQLFFTI
jgi:hypothetical protein